MTGRIIGWLIGLGLVGVVWLMVVWPATTPGPDRRVLSGAEVTATATAVQIEIRERQEAAERSRIVAGSFAAFAALSPWLVLVAIAGSVVWWSYSRRGLVLVDPERPLLHRRDIEDGAGRLALEAAGTALVSRSRIPDPVPAQITYSPTHAPHVTTTATTHHLEAPEAALQLPPACSLTDVLRVHTVPSGHVLLGLNAASQPVVVDLARSPHALIVGQTGSGKTVAARGLLKQMMDDGAAIVACDPHASKPDWAPFSEAIVGDVAVDSDQAARLLRWLVGEALAERLAEFRETGECHQTPIAVWIDEAASMVTNEEVPRMVAKLVREARKCNIRILLGSQDGLCGTLKLTSGERAQFTTTVVAGYLEAEHAPRILGRGHGIPVDQLGQGVGAVRFAGRSAQLVRLPMVSRSDLQHHIGSKGATRPGAHVVDIDDAAPSVPPATAPRLEGAMGRGWKPLEGAGLEWADEGSGKGRKGSGSPLPQSGEYVPEAGTEDIIRRFMGGETLHQIAADLAGSSGGRDYQRESQRVRDVIRQRLVALEAS